MAAPVDMPTGGYNTPGPEAAGATPEGPRISYERGLELLRSTREEIVSLRQEVTRLRPYAEAFLLMQHTFSHVQNYGPRPHQVGGYAPDVAWEIERALDEAN